MTPFTTWIDPIFSVNVLMLLAPALAAWATYLVCVRVTKRFWPSVMGGFVFGFSTYLNQHMRAHLNLVLIFFLPLAVYLVLRRIQHDIAPWVFVLLLGIDIAAQFTVSTELAATTAMFGGIALLGAFAFGGRALRGPIVRTTLLIGLSYVLAAALLSADPPRCVPRSATGRLPRPDAELRRRLEHRGPAADGAVRGRHVLVGVGAVPRPAARRHRLHRARTPARRCAVRDPTPPGALDVVARRVLRVDPRASRLARRSSWVGPRPCPARSR